MPEAGCRLQATTVTLGYDSASEVTSLQLQTNGMPQNSYVATYTLTGDCATVTDLLGHAPPHSFGYDQADRLITATVGSGLYSYVYDGDGLRQSKSISGTTESYAWDTAEGLPLLLQDNATRYINGPDGLPVESVSPTGTVTYFYQDQLGSTRLLLNGTGQTVGTAGYSAYGGLTSQTGQTTPFGYAGQYTDAETGFQDLRARYYDPITANFLTPDPLADGTTTPYSYAGDNPLNGADPAGLCDVSLPVVGTFRLPGTSGDASCTSVAGANAEAAARQGLIALNNGITAFANSDFSNVVSAGFAATVHQLQGLASGIAACGQSLQTVQQCATETTQAAVELSRFIAQHPQQALQAIAATVGAPLNQIATEIYCGQYGAAAGHALLAFVSIAGPGKLGEALKGIRTADEAAQAASEAEKAAQAVGGGSGPWADEGANLRKGGAITQSKPGSCVSACGSMLSGGTLTEDQLLSELGEWTDPTDLARALNAREKGWQGKFFANGDSAVAAAEHGPMGAVLQAPGRPAHMVVTEPIGGDLFLVRDPLPGVTYEVTRDWIAKYVSAGVWR